MSSLYRKEAMEKQASKHLGDVFLKSPPALLLASGLVGLVFLGGVLLAVFGEYTPRYQTSGKVLQLGGDYLVEFQNSSMLSASINSGQKIRIFYDIYPVSSYGFQKAQVQSFKLSPNTELPMSALIKPEGWSGPASKEQITIEENMTFAAELPGKPIKIWQWVAQSIGGVK